MKIRLVTIAATFIAASLAVGGCGGGGSDTLTLQEYITEFEAIDADLGAQLEELFAGLPEEEVFLADDANLPLAKETIAALPRIVGGTVDRLEALEPPSEVASEHNELVTAGEELVVDLEEDYDVIREVETMDAFEEALNNQLNSIYGSAAARFDDACFDLLLAGAAHGVTANATTCGEE